MAVDFEAHAKMSSRAAKVNGQGSHPQRGKTCAQTGFVMLMLNDFDFALADCLDFVHFEVNTVVMAPSGAALQLRDLLAALAGSDVPYAKT